MDTTFPLSTADGAGATRNRSKERTIILAGVALALAALLLPLALRVFAERRAAGPSTVNVPLLMLHFVSYLFIGLTEVAIAATVIRHLRRAGIAARMPWLLLLAGIFVIATSLVQFTAAVLEWQMLARLALESRVLAELSFVAVAILIPVAAPPLLRRLHSNNSDEDRQRLLESRNELQNMNLALQQEIRERRRVESVNQANFLRLQATLNSLPMGAIAIDEHDMVIQMNRRCCQLLRLGDDTSAFVGRPAPEYFREVAQRMVDPAEYLNNLDKRLAHTEQATITDLHLRDGRIVEKETVRIIADHQPKGYLILYRDITRERRIDASKSEFMSLASHQLRTPLTAIRWTFGRLSRSLSTKIEPAERTILNEGRAAAARMAHTIDTMLAISRIEAGQVRAEQSETKLGALLNEVRVECRELAEAKQQQVTLECPPNLLLHTDPNILQEILQNLYTNAIKYTPPGGHIRVVGERRGSFARIEVHDNGYGIPKEQQEKIFRKFFRADNIVQTDTEGTGLGLYLVSLLVQMLGGTISFTSAEGQGTTFMLDIPTGFAANMSPARRDSVTAR